ncbi:MAG TPA: HAD family hydrolase [Acidimicrobiales bacterium]|nr:HAD family hydrolase [Acidimicrobiales bacterium]
MSPPLTLGLDADDTLWENQARFDFAQGNLRDLLSPWVDGEVVDETLLNIERNNVKLYGYGVKSFTLSSIQAAVELTKGEMTADLTTAIIESGWGIIEHPVEILPEVAETLEILSDCYQLLLITKGDPTDQYKKISASGLSDYFEGIEVVREKDPNTYLELLVRHNVDIKDFVMVGNSVPSDVLPVLSIEGRAIHIPHHSTWGHEQVDESVVESLTFPVVDSFSQLPDILADLPKS